MVTVQWLPIMCHSHQLQLRLHKKITHNKLRTALECIPPGAITIQPFCEHLNAISIFDKTGLYRFEVRLELYAENVRLIVSPPSLSPSLPLSLRRHRHVDGQLSPLYPPSPSFSSFGAACVKLCCLPTPSLVRNIRLCCLV